MTIEEQLAAAHARHPRGLPLGFKVEHKTPDGTRIPVTLAAFQEWRVRGRSEIVGLVWVSHCPCGQRTVRQLTGNRPETLAVLCAECDVIGAREPTLDEAVVDALLPTPARPGIQPKALKQRGRMPTHVLEVIATLDPALQAIRAEELTKMAADLLPPPDEGKRDTRRQHVARAIDNLCREKNGEISRHGNMIVLYS